MKQNRLSTFKGAWLNTDQTVEDAVYYNYESTTAIYDIVKTAGGKLHYHCNLKPCERTDHQKYFDFIAGQFNLS